MSFNYRQGGSWNTPTVKRRQNGQWVTIGGGDDGGGGGDSTYPSYYYTDGPPERDGTTVTYDGTSHSSINAALDTLSPGDSLYIDPVNSPYEERIFLEPSMADHITIYSDGDISYNSTAQPTVNTQGAVIQQPSDQAEPFDTDFQSAGGRRNNTGVSLVGSYGSLESGANETEIQVSDASRFSAGDTIFVTEETRPYGEPRAGDAAGASRTQEFTNVTDVSGDTLTLDRPLTLPYPNNNETLVDVPEWVAEDIHISGLDFRNNGNSDDMGPRIMRVKDGWFDNIRVLNGGSTGNRRILNSMSLHNRFDHIYMEGGYNYGINNQATACRTLCTNIMADNINRYVVRFGPSGEPTTLGYADTISGRGLARTVAGVHHGGFHVDYETLTATDCRIAVTRSRNITVDGFTDIESSNATLVCTQRPANVYVRNGTVENKQGSVVFRFTLENDSSGESNYGNSYIENANYENIHIEPYGGNSITDIGEFTGSGSEGVDGLHFSNITYGDTTLTESHVQQWDGYSNVPISNLTVEP